MAENVECEHPLCVTRVAAAGPTIMKRSLMASLVLFAMYQERVAFDLLARRVAASIMG